MATIANLTLVGRAISALFDSGTILLSGWLGLLLANDSTPGRRRGWALALVSAALVTFTLTVQEPLDGMVPPVRLMLLEPATAVRVPPLQEPVAPLGVATTIAAIIVLLTFSTCALT